MLIDDQTRRFSTASVPVADHTVVRLDPHDDLPEV